MEQKVLLLKLRQLNVSIRKFNSACCGLLNLSSEVTYTFFCLSGRGRTFPSSWLNCK
jgi:hypothetical protein